MKIQIGYLAKVFVIVLLVSFTQACKPHYVAQVPVAPVEIKPAVPYANAVWINGGWGWRGGKHVWVPGYYVQPRKGHTYSQGEWRQSPRGNYYVRGRWR